MNLVWKTKNKVVLAFWTCKFMYVQYVCTMQWSPYMHVSVNRSNLWVSVQLNTKQHFKTSSIWKCISLLFSVTVTVRSDVVVIPSETVHSLLVMTISIVFITVYYFVVWGCAKNMNCITCFQWKLVLASYNL